MSDWCCGLDLINSARPIACVPTSIFLVRMLLRMVLPAPDQLFSAFALYLSCIALTQDRWKPVANLTCNCIALQGFQTVLVDLLVDLSTQACVTADSGSYLHGHLGDSLQEQLPRLPASIVDTLMTANMHPLQKQYLVQHAFLPCAQTFVEDARQAMMHWEADNAQTRLVILPAAFTHMLGTTHTGFCCLNARPGYQQKMKIRTNNNSNTVFCCLVAQKAISISQHMHCGSN